MSRRYSISTPVTLSVVAIVASITIVVGWNLIFAFYYLLGSETQQAEFGVGYWLVNVGGNVFMALIIATLALLLASTIRRTMMVRRQDTFIDNVTHELKTPLASIRLSLDTMGMRKLTDAQRAKFEGMMRADVDRLQAFIEHVLEAGRLEHGERDLRVEPVDVRAVLARTVAQIRHRHGLGEEEVEVEVEGLGAVETVMVDPMAFDIIALNLLDNAAKYSSPPRRIKVRAWCDGRGVWMEVSDQGVGLARRELKRVFDRFYRVERKDQPRVRGTGLGLYLVRTVVKRMGGTIEALSEGEGKGATFRVGLPRHLARSRQGSGG